MAFKYFVDGKQVTGLNDAAMVKQAWHVGHRNGHTVITKNGKTVFEMRGSSVKIDKLKPEWQCGVRVK